ncbi:DNA recombination protein RmuC [Desulfospira joergensenii]|uniref:DNA recombination protein RmuC n=1 Tax=Desulfospira joergensenii TaxID=53329 RepID=UPI0003B67B97|nr:DNA recombination protein RmuC [Desulfospira joergensenii]
MTFPDFSQISPDNLAWLALGFGLGILVCFILTRLGLSFFSGRLEELSDKALYKNSTRFMEIAESYFSTYVKEARKDFSIRGDEIRHTIDPIRQTLDRYESRLSEMEREREKAYGTITEKLLEMGKTQHLLHMETGNLVKALRQPHVRGRWGEITLRRVAELAGMVSHCDFEEQKTGTGENGRLRPDMVVTLPSNRKIIVDAKVPLMAYLDALEAGDENERQARMADHARQVMAHVVSLGSKQYQSHFSPSPEFVVLFIPGENFFSAALTHKPDLIERAVEKGVIPATPTTLIALLKAVSYSWLQKKSYENAEEIRDLGVQLHSRLSAMADHMNRLGKDIEKTAASFNRTVGAMEKRVMPPARKLSTLGLGSVKTTELSFLDPSVSGVRKVGKGEDDGE